MKIVFYGGETAGMITLLTLLAQKENIVFVMAEDEKVASVANSFNLNHKKQNQAMI